MLAIATLRAHFPLSFLMLMRHENLAVRREDGPPAEARRQAGEAAGLEACCGAAEARRLRGCGGRAKGWSGAGPCWLRGCGCREARGEGEPCAQATRAEAQGVACFGSGRALRRRRAALFCAEEAASLPARRAGLRLLRRRLQGGSAAAARRRSAACGVGGAGCWEARGARQRQPSGLCSERGGAARGADGRAAGGQRPGKSELEGVAASSPTQHPRLYALAVSDVPSRRVASASRYLRLWTLKSLRL
jgi:hypothetical protein